MHPDAAGGAPRTRVLGHFVGVGRLVVDPRATLGLGDVDCLLLFYAVHIDNDSIFLRFNAKT